MVEYETEVSEIIPRTPDIKSFRFKAKQDVAFKAGQFFFVSIKLNGKEASKSFSLSNSPTEKGYLEFTKRLTQSEFSQALNKIKIGDWVKVRLPYGYFTLEGERPKIAFLSGGIGITPIRSICKFIEDKKLTTDVTLIYGNNQEQDIAFREDFERMQKANKNFRVVYTLTSAEVDKKAWSGRTGYIDDVMIKQEIPDYRERTFFVCGPPKMVETLIDILKDKLGLPQEQIVRENFTGYA